MALLNNKDRFQQGTKLNCPFISLIKVQPAKNIALISTKKRVISFGHTLFLSPFLLVGHCPIRKLLFFSNVIEKSVHPSMSVPVRQFGSNMHGNNVEGLFLTKLTLGVLHLKNWVGIVFLPENIHCNCLSLLHFPCF